MMEIIPMRKDEKLYLDIPQVRIIWEYKGDSWPRHIVALHTEEISLYWS